MSPLSLTGSHFLALALPTAILSLLFYLIGEKREIEALKVSAQRGTILTFLLITAAVVTLLTAFFTDDFSLAYVVGHSSSTLPLFYKFAGLWAGLDGSILFWTWLVSLYSFILLKTQQNKNPDWMPTINAVMMSSLIFFLSLMVFANNPFAPLLDPASEGKGLNPLLQNIAMAVHPPSLYLGFTGFAVPFAFGLAALRTRRLDSGWIEESRTWTIIPWFFLTLGLILGGAWAYVELGWGGFWAWDPVENAAFIPWLLATAYLHSVMVQKRRGMLMVWNVVLVSLTFLMTIFGTYLTRSGVVQSVHAFSEGNLGPFFLGFMALIILVSMYFIATRLDSLKGSQGLESFFSKESAFLLNNIILLVAAFAVCWGTLFPTMTEFVTGERTSVGPPFFNQIMGPIGLTLLALMGIGPMVSWKKAQASLVANNLFLPLLGGLIAGIIGWVIGIRQWYGTGSVILITFAFGTVLMELVHGIRAVRLQKKLGFLDSFVTLVVTSNRRYGGYLVHVGVLFLFMGIAGSVFKQEADFALKPGESFSFQNYRFNYISPEITTEPHKTEVAAKVDLYLGDKKLGSIRPSKGFYNASEQPSTEAAFYHRALVDVYLIIANLDEKTGRADFRVTLNPLISFIWFGGVVILLGVGILVLPASVKKSWVKGLGMLVFLFLPFFSMHSSWAANSGMVHEETGEDPFLYLDAADPLTVRLKEVADKLLCQCGGCVRTTLKACTCTFAHKERSRILAMLRSGASDEDTLNAFIKEYKLTVLTVPPSEGFFGMGVMLPPIALLFSIIGGSIFIRRAALRNRKSAPPVATILSEDDGYADKLKKELDETP